MFLFSGAVGCVEDGGERTIGGCVRWQEMETSEEKMRREKENWRSSCFAPLAAIQKGFATKDFGGDCGVWMRASD